MPVPIPSGVTLGATGYRPILSADGSTVVASYKTSVEGTVAYRWSQSDGHSVLARFIGGGSYGATDLSADGRMIVGYSTDDAGVRAFALWQMAGSPTPAIQGSRIPDAANQMRKLWLLGITSDGADVLFTDWTDPADVTLFRWSPGAQDTRIPGFPLAPTAMSSNGNIVAGYDFSGTPSDHVAWRWSAESGRVDLGKFADVSTSRGGAEVLDVSGDGSTVVGVHAIATLIGPSSEIYEAFRWTQATGMVRLGDEYGLWSMAEHVSSDGSVILGSRYTGTSYEEFIWDANQGMRSLRDELVLGHGLDLDGWQITRAHGISNDGMTILGEGIDPTGSSRLWLATLPEPASNLMFLVCIGLGCLYERRFGNELTPITSEG